MLLKNDKVDFSVFMKILPKFSDERGLTLSNIKIYHKVVMVKISTSRRINRTRWLRNTLKQRDIYVDMWT